MTMTTETKMNPQDKMKADHQALKTEHSELGRLYELRGRDLASARKQAHKTDELQVELAAALQQIATLEKEVQAAEKAAADLQVRLDRTDDILDDVAALKRLVA